MPGASLWFTPPKSSPFDKALQTLISKTIPDHFSHTKTHDFIPHVTITSDIDTSLYGSDPQAWLGSLKLPSIPKDKPVVISLEALEPGEPFFKKLTLRAEKSAQLLSLVSACRANAVEKGHEGKADEWIRRSYLPHLSLMYADLPVSEVEKHTKAIEDECQKLARNQETDDDGVICRGGTIVLVDTSKPITEWIPIAEREVPDFWWMWPWSKSGFED